MHRVDGRQRQQPAAEHRVAMRLAGDGSRAAALGPRLDLTAGDGRRPDLPGAGERVHRRVEGATRHHAAGAHDPAQRDRHVVRQLRHGEVGAEVVRDRVEAAGVHQPGAGLLGGRVVGDVHSVDELRLTGEVDVVGAGLGARGDQRLAVLEVGPDRRDHDPGPVGDVLQRHVVGRRRPAAGAAPRARRWRLERGEVLAHRLELAPGCGRRGPSGARRVRAGRGTRR